MTFKSPVGGTQWGKSIVLLPAAMTSSPATREVSEHRSNPGSLDNISGSYWLAASGTILIEFVSCHLGEQDVLVKT